MSDLCDAYVKQWANANNKPKHAAESERICNIYIEPELGSKFVDEIGPDDIKKFLKKVHSRKTEAQKARKGGGGGNNVTAPVMANRVRACLSKMFAAAETEFDLPGGAEGQKMRRPQTNPVKGSKHHTERKRRRHATAAELPKLAEALDFYASEYPEKVAALWTLFLTGARVNEINEARRSEFLDDRLRKAIHKTDEHIGEKDVLLPPLPPQAVAILKRTTAAESTDPDPLLFGPGELRPLWEKVRERAKLGDLQLRDARRTFASAAKTAGKSLEQIGEMLHHENAQTTKGYSWLFEEAKRTAVNETAGQILALMRVRQPDASDVGSGDIMQQ